MPAPKELDPTTSLTALHGAKLRKLRLRAGWTQRELGDKIPIAHSRIAQFELGNETPPKNISDALDAVVGADGDLSDLWAHVKRTPIPDWARKYLTSEPQASKILKYMAHTVPGLLSLPWLACVRSVSAGRVCARRRRRFRTEGRSA
ncbi:helix-turn-helix domain-containing protein [Streptomyces hypolithicus]